jgi:hypothetical protein
VRPLPLRDAGALLLRDERERHLRGVGTSRSRRRSDELEVGVEHGVSDPALGASSGERRAGRQLLPP